MSEADLKQEAEQRLGTEIESSEWDKTKSYAERKRGRNKTGALVFSPAHS